jgi:hypothetical protein
MTAVPRVASNDRASERFTTPHDPFCSYRENRNRRNDRHNWSFDFQWNGWMPAVYLAQEIRQAFLEQQAETLRLPQASQTITG